MLKKTKMTILLSLVLGLLVFTGCANSQQTAMLSVEDYLQKNHEILDLKSDSEPISLLADVSGYDVFFTGESHHVSANFDVMYRLLTYLNKTAGVNYYTGELSYATASMINIYLDTGNELYIPKLFQEEVDFYKKVYAYNSKVAADRQIRLIGSDIEHDPMPAFLYLNQLLAGTSASESKSMETFKGKISSFTLPMKDPQQLRSKIDLLLPTIQQDVLQIDSELKNGLSEDAYFRLKMTLKTLGQGEEIRKNFSKDWPQFNVDREAALISNFLEITSHEPKGKYFGQWGQEHAMMGMIQSSAYKHNVPKIAQALNESERFKDKVLSVGLVYFSSEGFDLNKGKPYLADTVFSNLDLVSPLIKDTDKSVLIKLDEERSPFFEGTTFIPQPQGGRTIDYLQYMLLIKKSGAAHLYTTEGSE